MFHHQWVVGEDRRGPRESILGGLSKHRLICRLPPERDGGGGERGGEGRGIGEGSGGKTPSYNLRDTN